ncbi:MAG TPA: TonB-dependent receptor [Steroidobacteraceae bacterium]|nr:TonB-dependent receptor [Steroidobacteraceae bacterium]
MKSKISYAVAAILSGSAAGAWAQEQAPATTETTSEGITEVIVTAQRRSEKMQDVPISMQALTSQTLQQLNVTTFDDYLKYLPNVTSANNGPGQNEVFMRGLSAGSQASQGSGSTGLWPNVAIYLDNQSGQLPNRNLDIYAADIERIEVLAGPQGTLFGAGAEAGVIRYITNAPKLDRTEANVTATYGVTAGGDPNTAVSAVLNVPLIENTLAARAVIYNDRRGGYIDNVPATFTRKNTDLGMVFAYYPANALGQCPDGQPNNGYCVPPGSPALNNYLIASNNINPVTYQGIRAEVLYKFTDDWDLLITQSYQDMQSQGVFYQQPYASDGAPLQPLQVTLFNPAYNKDKFESTAWTVNGKFGDIRAVYTGGYLVRHIDQTGDYTNYARGVYADYYQCYGPGSYSTVPLTTSKCYSPSAAWHATEQNQHFQSELRFSTPDEWRMRGILGAFWEKNKLYDQTAWKYKELPPCTSSGTGGVDPGNTGCLSNVGTIPGTTVKYPGVQDDNTSFYQDQVREVKQLAFFTSVDFDLIPKTLTITGGIRWFRFDNSMKGSVLSSFGCFQQGLNGVIATGASNGCYIANSPNPYPAPAFGSTYYSYNLDYDGLSDTETGTRSRGNLTWHVTPDVMVYYTYSQGFRPGGFNQNGNAPKAYISLTPGTGAPPNAAQYLIPRSYTSDSLRNNEIGWKTEFFSHRLLWNGALYKENWNNVQIEFFNPGVVGNLFYDTNGQDFEIKGVETQLEAQITDGFTLQAAAAWNSSEQKNSPALLVNNPAAPGYGKPITNACNLFLVTCQPVQNPYGTVGSPSADAPPMQFSLHGRYEWHLKEYVPFIQAGAFHTAHYFTQAGANPTYHLGGTVSTSRGRFENPAYTTYDAAVGVSKDAWRFTLSCENLTNSNHSTFISSQQFITAQTPLRPRVINGTFAYSF